MDEREIRLLTRLRRDYQRASSIYRATRYWEHYEDQIAKELKSVDLSQVEKIRVEMERYQALRLQPHHVRAFFLEAFKHLGGTISEREKGRYRITHVPAVIRDWAAGRLAPSALRIAARRRSIEAA